VNEKNHIVGIVDVLDIALFVIGLFPKDIPVENLNASELRKVMETGSHFEQTEIATVLELSLKFKQNYEHMFRVKTTLPLTKLMEMFYEGVHRVIIVDEDGTTALNIVSQSDLLRILSQCLPYLDNKEATNTVNELALGTSQVVSVSSDAKTISVLATMQPDVDRPILSAVPVVDSKGRLVAVFSVSNLKGLRETNFTSLLLPVLTFLAVQTESKNFLSNLGKFKSLHPITCSPNSTFETLVEKMVTHKVHRLLVVEDNKPVGVISMGDLFKAFLPWASA